MQSVVREMKFATVAALRWKINASLLFLSACHCVCVSANNTHARAESEEKRPNPQVSAGKSIQSKINSRGRVRLLFSGSPISAHAFLTRAPIGPIFCNIVVCSFARSEYLNLLKCFVNPFLPTHRPDSIRAFTRERWKMAERFISFVLNWKFSVGFANGAAVALKDTGVTFPFQQHGVNDGFSDVGLALADRSQTLSFWPFFCWSSSQTHYKYIGHGQKHSPKRSFFALIYQRWIL